MQYIIFLMTIQIPFLYLVWKFFQSYEIRVNRKLKKLDKQSERMAHIVDTLRLSIEKSAENIYTRVKKIEVQQNLINSRIQQLEKYTGLRSNQSEEALQSIDTLRDKDFS